MMISRMNRPAPPQNNGSTTVIYSSGAPSCYGQAYQPAPYQPAAYQYQSLPASATAAPTANQRSVAQPQPSQQAVPQQTVSQQAPVYQQLPQSYQQQAPAQPVDQRSVQQAPYQPLQQQAPYQSYSPYDSYGSYQPMQSYSSQPYPGIQVQMVQPSSSYIQPAPVSYQGQAYYPPAQPYPQNTHSTQMSVTSQSPYSQTSVYQSQTYYPPSQPIAQQINVAPQPTASYYPNLPSQPVPQSTSELSQSQVSSSQTVTPDGYSNSPPAQPSPQSTAQNTPQPQHGGPLDILYPMRNGNN